MSLPRLLPESWKEALRRRAGAITMRDRLENLRRARFHPRRIIDAGAFRGDWTRLALGVFPEAQVLMIEPQTMHREALAALTAAHPGVKLRHALLGAAPRKVRFLVEGTNSRVLSPNWEPPAGSQIEEHQVETLADIVAQEGFADCDLLKLDLQGHELDALSGAGALFGRCEVIIVEVSWLRIGEVPLAHEVIARFDAAGYRLYDVFGHNYRPLDRALWQTDFVFVRVNSPLIGDLRWSA